MTGGIRRGLYGGGTEKVKVEDETRGGRGSTQEHSEQEGGKKPSFYRAPQKRPELTTTFCPDPKVSNPTVLPTTTRVISHVSGYPIRGRCSGCDCRVQQMILCVGT